jgi:DNA invertase Pin-like site-specific DNA recombinase
VSATGRLAFHVFAALTEFERNLICEIRQSSKTPGASADVA